ncbi:cytochrome P450 [Solicola gregarius]|uniref:Cytochrome P450 n=1 Tax=Solicola gregarius TaxID=2908642 RepID=A0AA46TL09_9ACTN|nr:cytochrome P450 [Solicola gregarius]UYM07025.1 cytochrome P450 [Solicola gregarius]
MTTAVAPTQLPPGPRIPVGLQTALFMTSALWYVPAMHRRYGDVFTLRCAPRDQRLVFINRREHIKEVFTGDPQVFHAGEGNELLRTVMGQHSVLLVDDETHLRARKLLMPAFHGAALRSYEGLVGTLAKSDVDSWRPGEPLVALDRMNALTLEIIMQVVFGVTDEERLSRLRPVVNNTVSIGALTLLSWAYPKLQKYAPWRAYMNNQRRFDELLYAEISERRRAADLEQRDDVLSRLLHVGAGDDQEHEPLSDAELRDQLVTLLLAGHETTASALSWTLHELAQNPDVQRRARRAADEGDRKYLEAVVKEAMRVHPVIDQVRRVLKEDATVAGYRLPAGTTVVPSVRFAHASGVNYPDPDAFRPERFVDGEVASNTWLPFGGGVRRCLGAGFSLMEGTIILGEILQRYTVRPDPHSLERETIRNITTVPKHKARVVLAAR